MATMQVELVSPERIVFSGEATQVITRTLSGDIAFLPGHAPFLGALTENHTRVYLADGGVLDVAVHGGFVEVSAEKVSILSDLAELGDQIDLVRAAGGEGVGRGPSRPRTGRRGRSAAPAGTGPVERCRRQRRSPPLS